MERNFNTDNFEHMLREATDEFRMYPSKRVWHGIYNDLHPAKRWPSFAILLLLVTSIMYIGVTNPDKGGQTLAVVSAEPGEATATAAADKASQSATSQTDITVMDTRSAGDDNIALPLNVQGQSTNSELYVASRLNDPKQSEGNVSYQSMMAIVSKVGGESGKEADAIAMSQKKSASSATPLLFNNGSLDNTVDQKHLLSFTTVDQNSEGNVSKIQTQGLAEPVSIATITNNVDANKLKLTSTSSATTSLDQSGWMEDYAFRNVKAKDSWKGRMAYQVYVTPSIGYRTLHKNTDRSIPAANALVVNPNTAVSTNYALNHSSAINLEIGGGMIYSASKMLRLKAGVQLNYTNYSVNAVELNHPTFTAIMLNNSTNNTQILSTRTTTLANTPGPTSKYFNNSSYQVSLPVGADVKIAGNDKLKLYVGAAIQPTYIIGGQSYLISSDMQNYVPEESFLRKFNLNGSVESFVTYKTPSGVTINVGPQFRYQFLSSYDTRYTYDEKLYNIGVKLGMTKNF